MSVTRVISLAVVTCAIIAIVESRFVDTLSKCGVKDSKCQEELITSTKNAISKTGIPEMDIPPIDPFEVKDIVLSILDLVELKLSGKAKGIKDCVLERVVGDIKTGHTEVALVCNNLVFEGKYSVSGNNPLLKNLFNGDSIHGDGNGNVKIEQVKVVLHYFYDVVRNKDGDIYFKCKLDKTLYEYEVIGKVSFEANNIYLGETDSTKVIVDFLNDNYKFVVGSFSRAVVDQIMAIVHENVKKFFDKTPAKYLIIEDLSEYVKN